ncbi:PD-(D/E)XK nuclease family protein [Achromobacter sp. SIMBA_011]|uniref:PD-(D/E)XK nuclease family protein n=1 Tax=Achromobacter sp. SIMBA_011 TaxID=3085759 RepID=UPI00397B5572
MNVLSDFERKFSIRNGFNLFEALNITRQEIRRSRFLAYLLDPNETHGLNDRFMRAILLAVLNENPDARVKRLSVALEDLSNASVHRERDLFDITVQIDAAGLAVIDLDVPALLTLRVRGDLQWPQLLEFV